MSKDNHEYMSLIFDDNAKKESDLDKYKQQMESYMHDDEHIIINRNVYLYSIIDCCIKYDVFRIVPYSTTHSFIYGINRIQYAKVKFIPPKKFSEWLEQMERCIIFYKLIITITHSFKNLRKLYHIRYEHKILYEPTSFSIEFKAAFMQILVKTGLEFSGGATEIINEPVQFRLLKKRICGLFLQMKKDLPESVFQTYYIRLQEIAQNDYHEL